MNFQVQKRKEFHEHQEGHYRKHADGSGLPKKNMLYLSFVRC